MTPKHFLYISLLGLLLLLCMNCGGGGGGGSVTSISIGGTGQGSTTSKPVELTAPIDSFSSIVVGGVTFDIDNATTMIDGESGNTESLQAGMWVQISGNLNEDSSSGTATSITYNSRIAGLVESSSSNVVVISGVNIIIQDDTQLGDNLSAPISTNTDIKVSGSYVDDDFLATYIDLNPGSLRIKKTKDELESSISSNTINILQIRLEEEIEDDLWQSGNFNYNFSGLSSDNLIDSNAKNQNLSKGKHVIVHANYTGSSNLSVTAYQVIQVLEDSDTFNITGTLSSKDSSTKTIVIEQETYKINRFTRFSDKQEKNFGFKDLEVGVDYELEYVIKSNSERIVRRLKRVRTQ